MILLIKGLKIYSIEAYILLMNRGNIVTCAHTKKLFCICVCFFWRRSWKQCDHWLTEWIEAPSPPPLFLKCTSCQPFQCHKSVFEGRKFERRRCCWDHLDWMCDWIQLRLCVNCEDFDWQVGRPTPLVGHQG